MTGKNITAAIEYLCVSGLSECCDCIADQEVIHLKYYLYDWTDMKITSKMLHQYDGTISTICAHSDDRC